ncbi:aromatase/cyclase [Streptomyces sp. NPDC002328]|uniref:aromatase/cyclase n=1 Tax=Streptomyces sp. NPDC002328 TaxID=3364642 RepID=UPI0036C74596
MSAEQVHRTSHDVEIAAPAAVVYGLISDTVQWPLFFPPNVHVERLEFDGTNERLRMWAIANGEVRSWTSRRRLDPAGRRVDFRQEVPAAPLTGMGGAWIVEQRGPGACRLVLLHDFTVADGRAEDAEWAGRATDANSRAELGRLKELAQQWARLDELVLSFEDSVRVEGPPGPVYDFLHRVADWPRLVPHVTRLEVTEDAPGVQVMSMDTRTADGACHTTESVRVCFPEAGVIVYKQTATPALMHAHTGRWSVVADGSGLTVTSRHSVVLREEAIKTVLGEDATVEQARRYIRQALGRNSTATLNLAKQHAESALPTR